MDDWRKNLAGHLEQYSATAIALKETEQAYRLNQLADDALKQINQQRHTPFDYAHEASLAAEYHRIAQEQATGMHAGLRHFTDYSYDGQIDRFSTLNDIVCADKARQLHTAMYSLSAIDNAMSIAELARTYSLHAALDPFRTSVDSLASKLLYLPSLDMIKQPAYLDAFMHASTISDIFIESIRADHRLQEATRQFSQVAVPTFATLNDYGQFLNAAGLRLHHWPHARLLTIGEKRRRFREKLNDKVEPNHVKKGKSLVQRYELTLRDILNEVMANAYGEEWAIERLPLCDCKDLLGKWQKRGGEVLSHADYAHYERIMSHQEHFEAVFGVGFDDPIALAELIKKAGNLRAALLHYHPFTPEDLRDLRLIWRTIETGLLALTEGYELESWN